MTGAGGRGLLLTVSIIVLWATQEGVSKRHWDHGGVKMGIPNDFCDNAKDHLEVDWDNSTNYDYTCQKGERRKHNGQTEPTEACLDEYDIPNPIHTCMRTKIEYKDQPPRGGPHRPLWPVYGEYLYVPPQRWVHNLEHGAAVFLYHPCANSKEVEKLKKVARHCLRRHIITPYRKLKKPFAVVTWGCRLTMDHVDKEKTMDFLRKHAIAKISPEQDVWVDGQYRVGLLQQSKILTDQRDKEICPHLNNNQRLNEPQDEKREKFLAKLQQLRQSLQRELSDDPYW